LLIVSEYIISVTSSTRLIATVPGGFASINMEVNPPSMTFTGYWTRRGLDGIERRIVIDDEIHFVLNLIFIVLPH